jgi:non-specific serine/threonine protein kinase
VTATVASVAYRFGRFELQPDDRRLLASGAPVPLRPNAFDLLVALVERSGHLVTKDELLERVWGKVIVEENTLQSHISSLRKVLGPDALATVPGRGYRFALEVSHIGPASTASVAPRKHNLPHALTSFIGREKEVSELAHLLGTTRLLTLTGAGGCGKTRVAIELAKQRVHAYADGAWLVELAALRDPELLPQTVASVLGIEEKEGVQLIDTIADYLESRALLLVLDNAEHLLEACAQLVETLLRRCERLVIIVTSRERLAVTGELTYRIPSLSVPDDVNDATPESIAAYESARLFIERARLQVPHFTVTTDNAAAIASLCRRLDGIALALELAAPRVRTLSVEELSRRLDRRFELLTEGSRTALPRQRTLRALIDWSYDLLTDSEKAMLRRVSVFSGGWTLKAAEHVCRGHAIEPVDTFDVLTSLADKNLIVAETHDNATRYGILETVRQYAQDLLREHGEEMQVHRQHLAYLVAMTDETQSKNPSGSQAYLDRVETELDNIRVALSWSTADGADATSGLRLAGALYPLWHVRGHWSEGRAWLSQLLAAAPVGQEGRARANALRAASTLAHHQDDHAAAEALANQTLAAFSEIGDRAGIAEALVTMGDLARNKRDYAAARSLFEQALTIRREIGDRAGSAAVLWALGNSAGDVGDYAAARTCLEESAAMLREIDDWRVAFALLGLAVVDYLQRDYASAKRRLTEALQIQRDVGHRMQTARSLIMMGLVAHGEGDKERAADSLGEAVGLLHDLRNLHHMCEALEGAAAVAQALRNDNAAARIWGSAERIREKIACPIAPSWRSWYERQVAAARATLADDAAFDRAWNEGRAMTVDAAVGFTLDSMKRVADRPAK